MATRTQAREAVIQLLYAHEMGNDNVLNQASDFLNNSKIRNKQHDFALELLNGAIKYESLIMQVISVFLKTWDITRIGSIEKSILKLGIYELLQTNTQEAIVINEAIELTRVFNVDNAAGLINGILDSVSKTSADDIADRIKEAQNKNKAPNPNNKILDKKDFTKNPKKTYKKPKKDTKKSF